MVNPPGKTRPPIPRTSCCLHVPSRTNACCSHTLGLSLSRLFQPVHPSTHYPSIQPSEHPLSLKWPWREEQCIHRGWIWPLWGQVGRRSAESPLAGSTGCGHTTIPATISLFLFPSLSLSPLPRSSFVVSLPSFLSTDDPSLSLSFSFSVSLLFPFAPSSRGLITIGILPLRSSLASRAIALPRGLSFRSWISRGGSQEEVGINAYGTAPGTTGLSTKQAHRRPITMARPS